MTTTANNELFKSFNWRWNGNVFEGDFEMVVEPDFLDVLETHLINKMEFDLGGMVGKVTLTQIEVRNTWDPPIYGFGTTTYPAQPIRHLRVWFTRP